MTVTVKFGPILKDLPTLHTAAGSYQVAEHSPLATRASAGDSSAGLAVKYPMWFKQNQQQQVLQEIERRFSDLTAKWQQLDLPEGDIIWTSRRLVNENLEALAGRVADERAGQSLHRMKIIWPSSEPRIITGPKVPNAPVELDSGDYEMTLTVNDQEYNVKVPVSREYGLVDSQSDLLKRMSMAINNVQPYVKARVEESVNLPSATAPYRLPGRGQRLIVESAESGVDFAFSDRQGNMAQAYGLNRYIPGGRARYEVDGQNYSSDDNMISFGDIVGVIKDSSNGSFTLKVTIGPDSLIKGVSQFLQSYNDLLSYLDLHSDYLRPSLKDRLISPAQDRAAVFSKIGISGNNQGNLKANDSFSAHLLGEYATTRDMLLGGENSWAVALMQQIGTIRHIGLDNYAHDLAPARDDQVRSRAWLDLETLCSNIIDAYY